MQHIDVTIGGNRHGINAGSCVMAKAPDSDFWFIVALGGSSDCHEFMKALEKLEDGYEYKKVKLD